MKLRKEISELLSAGIINQETADSIEQYYLTKAGPPQNKLVIIFGILGSILVGLGYRPDPGAQLGRSVQNDQDYYCFYPPDCAVRQSADTPCSNNKPVRCGVKPLQPS